MATYKGFDYTPGGAIPDDYKKRFGGEHLSPQAHFAYDQNPAFGGSDIDPDIVGASGYSLDTGKSKRTTPPQNISTSQYTGSRYAPSQSFRSRTPGTGDYSYLVPTGEMPEYGGLPDFNLPPYDRDRISELTEQAAGAPLGRLRQGLNRALIEARYSTNPNVRGLQRKRALAGYGAGIGDIRTSAHQQAVAEYSPEYQASLGKAGAEYQAGVSKTATEFQAAMNNYLTSRARVSTSGQVPEFGETVDPGGAFAQRPIGANKDTDYYLRNRRTVFTG